MTDIFGELAKELTNNRSLINILEVVLKEKNENGGNKYVNEIYDLIIGQILREQKLKNEGLIDLDDYFYEIPDNDYKINDYKYKKPNYIIDYEKKTPIAYSRSKPSLSDEYRERSKKVDEFFSDNERRTRPPSYAEYLSKQNDDKTQSDYTKPNEYKASANNTKTREYNGTPLRRMTRVNSRDETHYRTGGSPIIEDLEPHQRVKKYSPKYSDDDAEDIYNERNQSEISRSNRNLSERNLSSTNRSDRNLSSTTSQSEKVKRIPKGNSRDETHYGKSGSPLIEDLEPSQRTKKYSPKYSDDDAEDVYSD